MKAVKEFFKSKYGKLSTAAVSAMSLLAVGAFADGGEYDTATTALTSAITGLKTEAMTILTTVVGIAVVIMGGYWLIRLGMKWFKGLSK